MRQAFAVALVSSLLCFAKPAAAIPAFARKYGTSCQTCHTVFPKLTPFGEAFRRNGFRFPGVDSDYAKQDTITLSPGAQPTTLTAIPPLAFGFNGQAIFHPDKDSSGAAADNHARANLGALIDEAHVWTGGTLTDRVSYFGEVTLSQDGTVEVEHAQVYLNDLLGPAHAVNVRVGRGFSNVSSFGPHSSFLADALMAPSGVAGLSGATDGGWNVGDHYNGVELSGVLGGRVNYNAGWNAGSTVDTRSAEDVYGHVGVKFGGMSLDGEGASATNAARPWEETALTLDGFAYHAVSSADFGEAGGIIPDTINTVGGSARIQLGSVELNAGAYVENHNRLVPDGAGGKFFTQYDELSYIVVPWFVPAVRFEYSRLSPDGDCAPDGTNCAVSEWRLWPGVALLPYPNLKVVVTALFENASGAPPGGWGAVGGFSAPPSPTESSGTEFQNVQVFAAFAF